MTDESESNMAKAIEPKSDQLNADDLLIGPRTITIRDVVVRGSGEQPISVFFDGDNNKPFKPCKSMARVMVWAWGEKPKKYIGNKMTLYCDPQVKWGGAEVGGIRISHMSGIAQAMSMMLTATKGNKKPFTVKPLPEVAAVPKNPVALTEDDLAVARGEAENGAVHLAAWWKALGPTMQKQYAGVKDELKKIAEEADKAKESADDLSEIPEAFKDAANA